MATGQTILDATEPTESFIYIVPFGYGFSRQAGRNILVVAREEQMGAPEAAPFGSEILGVAGSGRQRLQPILFIDRQPVAGAI
jgi:hypothetical protein